MVAVTVGNLMVKAWCLAVRPQSGPPSPNPHPPWRPMAQVRWYGKQRSPSRRSRRGTAPGPRSFHSFDAFPEKQWRWHIPKMLIHVDTCWYNRKMNHWCLNCHYIKCNHKFDMDVHIKRAKNVFGGDYGQVPLWIIRLGVKMAVKKIKKNWKHCRVAL